MTSETPEGRPLDDIEPLAPIDPDQDDSDTTEDDETTGETDGDSPLGTQPTVN